LTTALGASLAMASGCRSDSGGDGNDDADDVTPDAGGEGVSIYDIQNGIVPVDTAVTLEGVVVTAISIASPEGVYVQDPNGGEYSGIFVYRPTNQNDMRIGDVVSFSGAVVEFKYVPTMGTPDDKSFTQIVAVDSVPLTLIKTGTATVTPQLVDAVKLAASEDEAEKWESVLVKFENVSVVQGLNEFDEIRVTGPFRVQGNLTPLTVAGVALKKDDCLASISGVLNYFYDYKLFPRTEADIALGGTACPAAEAGATACADTLDNDHNGFADCADFGCGALPECTSAASVEDIQTGVILRGQQVALTGKIVVALAKFNHLGGTPEEEHRVWIADSATAAANQGVLVFKPGDTGTAFAALAIGDVVDVSAAVVDEFFDLTELKSASLDAPIVITKTGTGAAPTPVTVTLAELNDPAMAEKYEGVLVKLENIRVVSTNPDDKPETADVVEDFGEWTVAVEGNATVARIDDVMLLRPADLAVNACYSSIVGVLNYDFSKFKIEPRSAADLTKCP
jgi:hypothetical protein